MNITLDQFEKLKALSLFADYYLEDYPKDLFPLQFKSDQDDILEAQKVITELNKQIKG